MDSIDEIKQRIIDEMSDQGLNQVEVERRGRLKEKCLWDFLNRPSKRPSYLLFEGIARGLGRPVQWLAEGKTTSNHTDEALLFAVSEHVLTVYERTHQIIFGATQPDIVAADIVQVYGEIIAVEPDREQLIETTENIIRITQKRRSRFTIV